MPIPALLSETAIAGVAIPAVRSLATAVGSTFGELLDGLRGDEESTATQAAAQDTEGEGPLASQQALTLRMDLFRHELQEVLDAFGRLAAEHLRGAGIDLSQPIVLKSDGRDGVHEAGYHSQRAEIEQVFHQHPELAQAFYEASAKVAQLPAVEQEEAAGELRLRLLAESVVPMWE